MRGPARIRALAVFTLAAAFAIWGCGGSPTGPSTTNQLPFVSETVSMRYFHEGGDTIEVPRQEAFNAWALERLGVVPPQKVEYRKYLSREAMGRYTGNSNTNGFAEPERFVLHTIWPFDNHEVVHVYSALVGRPSDFFNEGLAVSFQTDPANNALAVLFNGIQVHDACRAYLRAGTLPLPVSRYATSNEFRGIADQVMSYRMAGSFVLFLQEQYGLPRVLDFFRGGRREDTLATIRTRVQQSFGATLEEVEAAWLAFLR